MLPESSPAVLVDRQGSISEARSMFRRLLSTFDCCSAEAEDIDSSLYEDDAALRQRQTRPRNVDASSNPPSKL